MLLIAGCNKDADSNNKPISDTTIQFTPIPAAELINTSVTSYVLDNNQAVSPVYLSFNGVYSEYSYATKGFTSGLKTLDKYQSKIRLKAGDERTYYDAFKTWPLTNSIRNYVDLKVLDYTDVGSIYTLQQDVSFTLPNNGQIHVPSYSLYDNIGSFPFYMIAHYLKPSDNDYAVSLPCYPMVDEGDRRWFLNSYGIYLIEQRTQEYMYNQINFRGSNVLLKMPIPQNLINKAPDSIAVFNINNEKWVWQQKGFAHKVGNFYEKTIERLGFWNFAIPEDGVYVSLQLRTTTNCGIPNTRFKIKSGDDEIADQRTDVEGNAMIFVPVGKNLTIDFIQDHISPWAAYFDIKSQNLGTFNSATGKKITLPDRPDLVSIEGNVFNCDGSVFKNGVALMGGAKDNYIIPIKDGHFKTAFWIEYGYNLGNLAIIDITGNTLVNYKIVLGSAQNSLPVTPKIINYNLNFYTCYDATKVYCNYNIDSVNYTIAGDASDNSINLTEADFVTGLDVLNLSKSANSGLAIGGYFQSVLGNFFNGNSTIPTGLKVNGFDCQFDPNGGESEIAITRRDVIGGYIEGWFSIHYKDHNNVPHFATGNFRVKRIS